MLSTLLILRPPCYLVQLGQTVHTMELVGAEPGANMLFDDPRKVLLL